jgi:hypothetical protein
LQVEKHATELRKRNNTVFSHHSTVKEQQNTLGQQVTSRENGTTPTDLHTTSVAVDT